MEHTRDHYHYRYHRHEWLGGSPWSGFTTITTEVLVLVQRKTSPTIFDGYFEPGRDSLPISDYYSE